MTDDDHHSGGQSSDHDQSRPQVDDGEGAQADDGEGAQADDTVGPRADDDEGAEAPGALPRFVRSIGVLPVDEADPGAGETEVGSLPAFGGVLQVGVDGRSGVPPALTYLTLTDLLADSFRGGSSDRTSSGSRDTGSQSGSGDAETDDEQPRRVREVLRESDRSDTTSADRSRGPVDGLQADARGVDGSDRLSAVAGPDTGPADEGDAPIRDLRGLGASPGLLGSDRPGAGGGLGSATAPRTVVSTAVLPGLAAGAGVLQSPAGSPARSADRSPRRTSLDPTRDFDSATSPAARETAGSPDVSTTGGAGSDPASGSGAPPNTTPGDTASTPAWSSEAPDAPEGVRSTVVSPPRVRAAIDRDAGKDSPSVGSGSASGIHGAASGTDWTGAGQPVQLTLLNGDDGSGDEAAGGAGADRRGTGRPASESRTPSTQPNTVPDRTAQRDADPHAAQESGAGAPGSDSGLPVNLAVDEPGGVGRFVERLYRELVRMDRVERRRRGF